MLIISTKILLPCHLCKETGGRNSASCSTWSGVRSDCSRVRMPTSMGWLLTSGLLDLALIQLDGNNVPVSVQNSAGSHTAKSESRIWPSILRLKILQLFHLNSQCYTQPRFIPQTLGIRWLSKLLKDISKASSKQLHNVFLITTESINKTEQ